MRWPEMREAYPDQWLVIEALEAHSVHTSRDSLEIEERR
jgi:hypothetical protein